MEVKDYCERVGNELAAWKAKMNSVSQKAAALKDMDRQKAEPIVKELNAIMDDIDQRIATLAAECPSEWSDDKSDIDGKISRAKDKWKEAWGVLGEDETEYGIGGA
ncbi:MAG: hypothetical protein JRE88_11880 [Deltaproteobacteria bacterium]|jgi:hypothetical protein|nr:hypothetical protein [Deltaproteobacteria bacterium]MBW2517472.1 hypothetical protein [Deltaproteobacteria bacterium]